MYKMQTWLLALLGCFYANMLFAQINVNVEIRGVSSALEENIRLYLSIEQQKSQTLMSEDRPAQHHSQKQAEGNACQPDHQRGAGSIHQTRPKIASLHIGAHE